MEGKPPGITRSIQGESMKDAFSNDVIIVGGGPAGSTAAYLLKQQGFKVLLIDKSTFPRKKLCGGMLTNKSLRLLGRIYGETIDSLEKDGLVEYISHSYELRINHTRMDSTISNPPFVAVDRSIYDNALLEKARQIGVEVIEGEAAKEVDPVRRQVLTSSGRVLEGRFIIGADGVNSVVRKAFPKSVFKQEHWKNNLAAGIEMFIPRADFRTELNHPVIHFGLINWGYGWIFPNREKIIVGVGALARHNRSMKKSLNSFLMKSGYKKETLPEIYGCPVPYGNYLTEPVHDSIILLGDAAGFADPFMGEGIYFAQRSAELASRCIGDEINGKSRIEITYPQVLWRDFLQEFDFMMKIRWLLFGLSPRMDHLLVKMVLDMLGPGRMLELIQGGRSFRWFRKKPSSIGI
jgi:geranylgeranyl reductase family protein